MSTTNAQRHDLHSGLQEVLGEERAETLMDYLPPVGWADVATKRDLDLLGDALRSEMSVIGAKIDVESASRREDLANLGYRMIREQRVHLTVIIAAISSTAAAVAIFV